MTTSARQVNEEYATHIQRAREKYAMRSSNDIEIDDAPGISVADEGVWVAAWVWVDNRDVDGEEESTNDE